MIKKLLQRIFQRGPQPDGPEELALSPLTVLDLGPEAEPHAPLDIDRLFFPWLLDMRVPAEQDLNEDENRLLRALKREADSANPDLVDLIPRIPAVIPLLLRSLRDQNVSNAQLASQVSQDPVLVAAVLRQVNSSYLRRSTAIKTIEDAIAVIGQNGLRILVATVAFKPLFNPGLGQFTAQGAPRIWELAEPYALACRCVAAQAETDEFEAFLAGLLQNVGIIVALRVMDQAGGAPHDSLQASAFHASFLHYTRRLARLVGEHWEFPPQAIAANDAGAHGIQAEVLQRAQRAARMHLLIRHGVLDAEQAQAGEDEAMRACLRDIDAGDAQRTRPAD